MLSKVKNAYTAQKKGFMQHLLTGTIRVELPKGCVMAKKNSGIAIPDDYAEVFESLKARVRQSQTKAMLSVNRELISMYWEIGRQIVGRQERDRWGKSIVDRLARDLRASFPAVKGFSPGNVWRMRAFYLAY